MIKYEIRNVNPKNRKTGDCVVRALTVASGRPYIEVYKDLFELSLKTGYSIGEKRTYEKLLTLYGFTKFMQPKKPDNTKYTIGEIDKLLDNNAVAVVSCANHLTAVVSGSVVDIWDCRDKSIGNFYLKRKC